MNSRKLCLGLSLVILTAGCSNWQTKDRENFIRNCAADLDRQTREKPSPQQSQLYCTCILSETEARFPPAQTGQLPPVVVDNCARKANLKSSQLEGNPVVN
jgi:hypothetical protein